MPVVTSRAVFQHRDFRRYAASWSLSTLGAEMLAVAIAWQIYAITHCAIDLGYVGLAQFVPAFALSLVGGHVADRVDRAFVVAVCNLALAGCGLSLLALTRLGVTSVAPVYAVLVLVGVARTFEAPAAQALVPGLVPAGEFPSAVSWTSTAWQVAAIAGPAVGGALYGLTDGATVVYGVTAVVFAASSSFAFSIRSSPTPIAERAASWREVLAGLHFVRKHPVILGSVSLDLFAVLFGGATALLPIYASDILHVGASGLGALRAAPAVGAAAMALVLAHRPLTRRAGSTLLGCVALFGAATVVFGLSRTFAVSLAALAVLGASDMVSVVIRGTVVQLRTPPDMRGRVSAVNTMFIATSSDLGQLESGVAAAWFGVVPAVVLGGVGTLVAVAIYALRAHSLREVDRLDDVS